MKYIILICLVAFLVACGGPSYRLQQQFVSACVNHGGIDKIVNKGYNVYVCHCRDSYSIKGIQR